MAAKRTKYEMETIILMNAAEDTVEVYTADPVYMRKCDALCKSDPGSWKLVKEESDSKTYQTRKVNVGLRKKVDRGTAVNKNSLDNLRPKKKSTL